MRPDMSIWSSALMARRWWWRRRARSCAAPGVGEAAVESQVCGPICRRRGRRCCSSLVRAAAPSAPATCTAAAEIVEPRDPLDDGRDCRPHVPAPRPGHRLHGMTKDAAKDLFARCAPFSAARSRRTPSCSTRRAPRRCCGSRCLRRRRAPTPSSPKGSARRACPRQRAPGVRFGCEAILNFVLANPKRQRRAELRRRDRRRGRRRCRYDGHERQRAALSGTESRYAPRIS